MQRHEKVAEALKMFPASVWVDRGRRSWDPDKQFECISVFRHELDCLQKLINVTSTLVEYGYPMVETYTCRYTLSIGVEQKVPHDPTVTFTINEGLTGKIEQYMVLKPDVKYEVGVHVLCIMEATSEYLTNRIAEETTFLGHLTMEIGDNGNRYR